MGKLLNLGILKHREFKSWVSKTMGKHTNHGLQLKQGSFEILFKCRIQYILNTKLKNFKYTLISCIPISFHTIFPIMYIDGIQHAVNK